MGSRHLRRARIAFVALLLLTIAAWLVPTFLSANRFRRRLEAGLERALQRPVTFSSASFRVLPRPGFAVENAVVHEDPAFGPEPFARVDRIECDLRVRSLWHSRLDFFRLRLERPSLNIVRNAQGEWNVENLLLKSGVASARSPSATPNTPMGTFDLEAEDARLNFKVGADKKPFAIVDLRARLTIEPARGLVRYRLSGNPVRTDSSLPPPGLLELTGEWRPGADLGGSLDATLQTRGALLYNWVPLVTGRNPEIYGVFDADVHLSGSLRVIKAEGQARLMQLHRWELLPPSDPMPFTVHFRGEFDRPHRRALLESVDATFADSHIHLTGAVGDIPASPELDLVVALERARLEDLLAVTRRFWAPVGTFGLSGRVDGLMSIQGPWRERRYGGFVGAREVTLSTPSMTFPVSEVALRIDNRGARLAPVRFALAPHVELVAEGSVERAVLNGARRRGASLPSYELRLSAKSVPLGDLVRFGRGMGIRVAQGLDAQGAGTASFVLSGTVWPFTRPVLVGRAELQAVRLIVPGLTEPLNIPRARVLVNGDRIVVEPLVAVMGTSVFTGRLEHRGERSNPWEFQVKADALAVEQGALWFDVLGHRPPLPLLERIPGLSSFSARRTAARGLFGALNAKGQFETPIVSYRSLHLEDFRASVEVSGRVIRLAGASFKVGKGSGRGSAEVDLTNAPARVAGEATLAGTKLQTLAVRLPAVLQKVRGTISGSVRFETRGLTREEMSASLSGRGTAHLRNITLGDFDPLQAVSRQANWSPLESARGEVTLPSASIPFEIRDRRVSLAKQPLELEGAKLTLSGNYAFDGTLDLDIRADFRHLTRRWVEAGPEGPSRARVVDVHLVGSLARPVVTPGVEVSRATR
jgi:hypothetical protein